MISNANGHCLATNLRKPVNISLARVMATNVINDMLINAKNVCEYLGCANQVTLLRAVVAFLKQLMPSTEWNENWKIVQTATGMHSNNDIYMKQSAD